MSEAVCDCWSAHLVDVPRSYCTGANDEFVTRGDDDLDHHLPREFEGEANV